MNSFNAHEIPETVTRHNQKLVTQPNLDFFNLGLHYKAHRLLQGQISESSSYRQQPSQSTHQNFATCLPS